MGAATEAALVQAAKVNMEMFEVYNLSKQGTASVYYWNSDKKHEGRNQLVKNENRMRN